MSKIPEYTAEIRRYCNLIDAEVETIPPEPPTARQCLFGYFGDNPTIVAETKDHADLTWAYGWPTGTTAIQVCKDAKVAGNQIMLGVYGEGTQQGMEYFFQQCQAAGVLESVAALYPMDEPDVAGKSDAWVKEMVAMTRRAAAKFSAIAQAPVAVFYGPGGKTPGIEAFDWIGRDNYGAGPQILPLETHQRLMLIPGGASPWRESPDSFVSYAQTHPEVIAVVPFIWQWPSKPPSEGIKGNGMASAYRAAGKTLTGR